MPAETIDRKKVYVKRKKSGLCPRCGNKIKKNSRFTYCEVCREYYRNYNREISDEIQKVRRQRYATRKAKNLCPRCGIKVGKNSKNTICPKCLDKQYYYNSGKN